MPKYRNSSANPINVYNTNFKPGEEKEVFWYAPINSSLTLVSDAPVYSPVIYSTQLTTDGDELNLRQYIDSGEAVLLRIISNVDHSEFYVNAVNADQVITVRNNTTLELRNLELINKIILKTGTIIIEVWRPFAWRV